MVVAVTGQGRVDLCEEDGFHVMGFCWRWGLAEILKEIDDAERQDRAVQLSGAAPSSAVAVLRSHLLGLNETSRNQDLRTLGVFLLKAEFPDLS